jgi:putative acyl-CoA dehydrogenase
VLTALGKYWVCKRATPFVNEAQECLGGIGYVEDTLLPRLLRQAPLNSIWEGSGNIQCLDVLRALAKAPETGAALWRELQVDAPRGVAANGHGVAVERLRGPLLDAQEVPEAGARGFVEALALALLGRALLRARRPVAGAFCRTRLAAPHALAFGALPAGIDCGEMIARAL